MSNSTPQRYLYGGGSAKYLLGKLLRAQAVWIAFAGGRAVAVNQFLAVNEQKIDADRTLELRHRLAQFHQNRHAAGPIVRAQKRALRILRIAIGKWPRIVMGHQQYALLALRMPLDQQVRHRHRIAAERMPGGELLLGDRRPQLLEVIDQQLLLRGHAGRSTDPRSRWRTTASSSRTPPRR